jgi:hypothetical protein
LKQRRPNHFFVAFFNLCVFVDMRFLIHSFARSDEWITFSRDIERHLQTTTTPTNDFE